MQEILDAFRNVAEKRKAGYSDIRVMTRQVEALAVRDGRVDECAQSTEVGLGVRVLHKGRWGFAAGAGQSAADAVMLTEQALKIAEASALGGGSPVQLDASPPQQASWSTPVERDPFAVPLDEKLARLLEADAAQRRAAPVSHSNAFFNAWREDQRFVSTEGADIHQVVTECGGGIKAEAIRGTDQQVRCWPNSFRGQFHTAGYEAFLRYDLAAEAPRCAEEAVALLDAPPVPEGETTLILDGPQLALQIHESIGHPLELDRVLGFEAAYAGTSFVAPGDIGRLRYGSELMHITCDPTLPGGLGSYAYDDDGVPTRRDPLIESGVLSGFLTSRETAPVLGRLSNGCNRADGYQRLPLVRMPNVNLEPGELSLDELIGGVDSGYLFSNNRSWSIDDKRVNFQFGCEAAFEISGGKLTGRLFKNPTYTGITTQFWGSLSGVCGREWWNIWGTPNCGKGQPSQTAHVAHGCSPSRFENVRVGVR